MPFLGRPALAALLLASLSQPSAAVRFRAAAPMARAPAPSLPPAEAAVRFAEFFGGSRPRLEELRPALASLDEPAAAKAFEQAVARLIDGPAPFDDALELKHAVLARPELASRLRPELRAAVAAAAAKREEARRERAAAEVSAALEGWDAPVIDAEVVVAAPAASSAGALVPKLASATGRPAFRERAFAALPARARSALARRSERFKAAQVRALLRDAAALLPADSLAVMAELNQTSHDYAVHWLPKVPEAAERAADELLRNPDFPWFMASSVRDRAEKQSWFERLADAKAVLEEAAALQGEAAPAAERAVVRLALGLLDGFTYGFATGVARRDGQAGPDRLGEGDRASVDRATERLREALASFESAGDERAALATRFLLGKHALNGRYAWSNPGRYTYQRQKVPPEPKAKEYEALAREMLGSVASAAASAPGSSEARELLFRARFFLLELDGELVGRGLVGSRREPDERVRVRTVASLLSEHVRSMPRESIEVGLADRNSVLVRAVGELGWFRNAIPSYEALLDALAARGFGPSALDSAKAQKQIAAGMSGSR